MSNEHAQQIREFVAAVRRRWTRLQWCRAVIGGALTAALVLGIGLAVARVVDRHPVALALVAAAAVLGALGALAWWLAPLRRRPSDARMARFIEERVPALEDRLASAVDLETTERRGNSLAEPMLADASRRAQRIDLDEIVPSDALRRATIQAAAAVLVLATIAALGGGRAREAYDAAALALFPERIALEVTPGNARVQAGTALAIDARLVGNRAPVAATVQIADGETWRPAPMASAANGRYHFGIDAVTQPFRYRVVAGPVTSATYAVSVVHPPQVMRIDADYTYPPELGLKPRTEEDTGDLYAPAGTDVRIRIRTDRPAAHGELTLGDGKTIPLSASAPDTLTGSLKIVDNNSYRVALADAEGMKNPGETEYFIRTLADRPPEVHITRPAADRGVTKLEEVDVEAQADDDYGIAKMDLIYSVRGGPEKVVPLAVPAHATTVTAHHTLYLEDMDVQPGDFVSYYVRARDLTRGTRSNEARSDIFFLEVKPFEQEFSLAQSQSMAGSGYTGSLDDLIAAQKQVVVATWKLDRRSEDAKGARSEQDIKTVSRSEADIKARVEQTSSSFRESTMRDPRKRPQRGRGGDQPGPDALKAGQTMPEEDAMTAAAEAMGRAITSLDALQTRPALPPEMEALNHLLKANADVKKRQIARQQAGAGGAGNNNRNYDVSTLFDKELQKQQQTNYETPASTEKRQDANADSLDKIRDLARRQDELLRRQDAFSRNRDRMSPEDVKRELEKLTRDQLELRQRAEELSRQMAAQQSQQGQPQGQRQSGAKQAGQQAKGGEQSGSTQSQGQPTAGTGAQSSEQLREASSEMQSAASELRRQDPSQASARASRALDKLRSAERQLQSAQPDEQHKAIGDMELESRQLADAERQVASEVGKIGQGDNAKDAMRRLAGEQERIADRAKRLQEDLKQQAAVGGQGANAKDQARGKAVGDAARELERQRVDEKLRQSADRLRAAAGGADPKGQSAQGGEKTPSSLDPRGAAGSDQEIARALDKLADQLASANAPKDGDARRLGDELNKAQQLRDRLSQIGQQMEQLARTGQPRGANANQSGSQKGQSGQTGQSGQSGQAQAGQQSAQSGQQGGQQGGGQQGQGQSSSQAGQAAPGQGGAAAGELARLRDEYARQLRETQQLIDQLRREDPSFGHGGGAGFTFEGQGMTLSAPGTEAFKQDFAKWEELRRAATQALDNAQTTLSKKLQAQEAKDRLAAGVDDKAPPSYQQAVDDYFKALAAKKK